MRLDKFLQVSRIIKRRSIAKEIIEKKRVQVNNKEGKPGLKVKPGDELILTFGDSTLTIKVLSIDEKTKKADADTMYEIISQVRTEQ